VIHEFRARTRIVIGRGCVRERLADELAGLGDVTVAVVADRGYADAGLLQPLLAAAGSTRLELGGLIGVDPDVEEAERAAQAARDAGAQAVLAIGGGSALCAGKAVAILLANEGSLHRYRGRDRLGRPPAPTIAIPTTAGSGSEVSTVVVLHDHGHEQHLVIRGRGYEPEVAMLDGTLLRSLPERPMIEAALDALSHCFESLWARRATPVSDALALAAARSIREALPGALHRREQDMQALIVAAAMANLACGNAELGIVHALTSAPGVTLPHGYQNGVLLPHVASFNRDVLPAEALAELEALAGLYERIGFVPAFAAGELTAAGAELMVAAALANPFLANNRRAAGEPELRGLLAAAGAPVQLTPY
jgi:alcohol dehydrogenase class IV